MLTLKPELQRLNPLAMTTRDPRHIASAGTVGFAGGRDHGGAVSDLSAAAGQGAAMGALGSKIGAQAVLRDGSLGAAGLNRSDGSSFADVMLGAIDKVSAMNTRASDLAQQAIVSPESVDIHDITIAQAEAQLSLSIAQTFLSRLTQSWKDLINTR
ncbi:MAG: flagellar hook-basal body complex protein FliE [Spirochaetaceae bacterium]|jgi:flagellar hook-basal body complex protein FliE|nr:flagellar hook-basal body complex protein FliE [Spirochaetaceae bacterium]